MSRSLLPKEHGAYAQLGLPLATALIGGGRWPSRTALLFTVAAIALFFAHEPLLVVIGRRGVRARREAGRLALRRLMLWLAIAALGVPALILAERAVRFSTLVPLVLFLASAVIVAFNRERTLVGESILAACLASAAMPVAVASGWSMRAAGAALFVWSCGLLSATIAVRGVLAAKKRGVPPARTATLVVLGPVGAALLALLGVVSFWTALASLPLVVVAVVVAARPPRPRALPAIGWALVAATALTGAAIAIGVAS